MTSVDHSTYRPDSQPSKMELRQECERIWREETCSNPVGKSGWLLHEQLKQVRQHQIKFRTSVLICVKCLPHRQGGRSAHRYQEKART